MILNKITITGADDTTDIDWMRQVSEQYPTVEWGILVSKSQMGSQRFPGMEWIEKLEDSGLHGLSMHVCGRWVREICGGDWDGLADQFAHVLQSYDRLQLNFHRMAHKVSDDFYKQAKLACEIAGIQLILQLDGVNDHLLGMALAEQVDAVPLFDLSGGAGVVPTEWPVAVPGVMCGYAGGLGPDNIVSEMNRIIQKVEMKGEIWLDMETRVRTHNGYSIDQGSVESVLEQIA